MRFLLSAIALLMSTALMAQTIPADKLVAYFPFSKCDVSDDSGNNSSGAIIGDTLCVCGTRDNAMRFDTMKGSSNSLLLVGPLTDVFTTSDFTVSFYMRPIFPSPGGPSQVVLSKQENCDSKTGFWVRYNAKANKISSGIGENDTLVSIVQASLDRDLCWQYVSIVRSNTRYSLYVNGQLKDSKTAPGRINLASNAPVKVSQVICSFDQNYFGDLDDLRFHNKALSEEDVRRYFVRPDRILNSDTLLYLGNSVQVNISSTCATSFKWLPAAGVSNTSVATPVLSPEFPTAYAAQFVYTDTLRKGNTCTSRDTLYINVIDPDTLDCDLIFIPNAFTPGGSPGRNDLFGISNPFSLTDFISLEIFDRWGGLVFSASTPFDTWDGTFQGKPLNAGVFLYRLRYRCKGEEKVKSGTLALLR